MNTAPVINNTTDLDAVKSLNLLGINMKQTTNQTIFKPPISCNEHLICRVGGKAATLFHPVYFPFLLTIVE